MMSIFNIGLCSAVESIVRRSQAALLSASGVRTAGGTTDTKVASRFEDGEGNFVYSLLTESGRQYALGGDGCPEGDWVTGDGTPLLLKAKKLASGAYQVLVKPSE